jgi:hypothetical protein
MDENTSIVSEIVRPLTTVEGAVKAWQNFEDLKSKLLTAEDYQTIQGKQCIKRSGFRKLAVFFGLSDRIVEQERTDREDGSFMWRIVVEVKAPQGRTSTGVGICDSKERSFAHPEHDVYATSHTRAKNRAISDMIAGGAVSAEEMEATSHASSVDPQEEVMTHNWKGRKKKDETGYEEGSLSWGWDFWDAFSQPTLDRLQKGELEVGEYMFGLDNERRTVYARKKEEQGTKRHAPAQAQSTL